MIAYRRVPHALLHRRSLAVGFLPLLITARVLVADSGRPAAYWTWPHRARLEAIDLFLLAAFAVAARAAAKAISDDTLRRVLIGSPRRFQAAPVSVVVAVAGSVALTG